MRKKISLRKRKALALKRKRSRAAKKGWETRKRKALALKRKRSRAAKERRQPKKVTAPQVNIPHYLGCEGVGKSNHYGEERLHKSGWQFLGYFEGRPEIVGVLKVTPFGRPGRSAQKRGPTPPEVLSRIRNSAPVRERGATVEEAEAAWWACEDDGAMVECEIDYEREQ